MADKFSYSCDEEHFHGEFDSREAAIEEARHEYADLDVKRFWTSRNAPADPLHYIHADLLIEHIINQDEFCIEAAEGWPPTTKEDEEALTETLRATFAKWMADRGLTPEFWVVEDVREHRIEQGETVAPMIA